MKKKFKVALTGNPNCGKTCIFNALTGARQHVGNYPGVTVESKSGTFTLNDMEIELIDLPGVYSLSSSSPEEEVAFEELTTKGIDLIINVIDSTIPQRSLYLTTQLAELHIPMLLAFNMSDDAKKKGFEFNISKLEKYFGSPIVQTVGSSSHGVRPLMRRLARTLTELEDHGVPMLTYGQDIDDAINAVAEKIDLLQLKKYEHIPSRFFAIKLLERDSCVMNLKEFTTVKDEVEKEIKHLWSKHAINADTFMADRRYAMLAGACRDTITFTHEKRREISDKIDIVLTNRYLGLPVFLVIMYFTFWFTFTLADPLMGYIEAFFGFLSGSIEDLWAPDKLPVLRSLVTDGIIGGVGGVIVFLPNILFLFFAIAILEDSGYMSRAAFIMDGIMRRFGLQGRSFVPLVLGFGCTVPAIMATRTIESERDRNVTIAVLPFMSCGARLPIYALIIPAFFSVKYQATVMWIVYLIGVLVALIGARLLKSTLFKGDGEVYLMELPPYRLPTLKSLMLHMWDRGRMYLQKAATIILATSVVLYICNTYPQKKEFSRDYDREIAKIEKSSEVPSSYISAIEVHSVFSKKFVKSLKKENRLSSEMLEEINTLIKEKKFSPTPEGKKIMEMSAAANDAIGKLENEKMAEKMEYTISGRLGKALEKIFRPMGFDWKVSTATIGALAAKEVFVSQLGILYAEGEADEENIPLRKHLQENYTPLQGFCMMLFALLSIPCLATLAIMKKETNSWKMPIYAAIGFFLLAYISTTIVFQLGTLLRIGTKFVGF